MRKLDKYLAVSAAMLCSMAVGAAVRADDVQSTTELASQIKALQAQVSDLQSKENENWLNEARTEQIKAIVRDVLADAKTHGEFSDGPNWGYKDGFFIQDEAGNYKMVINGYVQTRYVFTYHHDANTHDSLHPISSTSNQEDTSGFDVRRARLKFTGNVVSPDIIYKFYGDFYGASTGAFTVLEAYAGYNFNDMFKVKAGSMEIPFSRVAVEPDTKLSLAVRPEQNTAMLTQDTPRTMGASLYGNLMKNGAGDPTMTYEVQVNNGTATNTLRRPDTTSTTANVDNRMGFYSRVVWAGAGAIKDFGDEPDLRTGNRDFIWLLDGGIGYESQNASSNALPAPQNALVIGGVSNKGKPGFETYTLNGDVFRATFDWVAKYQGWSFQASGLFQQINANPGAGVNPPFAHANASFFQHGYYAQVGYMLIPQKLELVGRGDWIFTEGGPNIGEYYTVGANYYIAGHNAKIQADVTYTPESPYTDASEEQLQNTHELIGRVQFQIMF